MVEDALEEGEIEGLVNESPPEQERSVHPSHDQGGLHGKKRTKKQKKQNGAKDSSKAYYDVYGQEARAGIQIDYAHPIRIADVQNLVLWTLADGTSPHWAFLKNKPLISKVVMVAVPGLGASLFQASIDKLSCFAALPAPVKLIAKSAMLRPFQSMGQLFSVPHSRKRKKYLESLEAGMDLSPAPGGQQKEVHPGKKRKRQPFPPKHYVASVEVLKTSDYDIPEMSATGDIICPEGYAATRPGYDGDEKQPELFGIDCEMCITAEGFELTRVSLINEQLEVLLDELVLPRNAITDYNTQFSGITAEMLAPVTTRLEDVRCRILDLIPAEGLLVGHALHNDLRALKLVHTRVIDTGFLYPHPKGPPYRSSLKRLTEKFLKRQIQTGSHDSIDDARAAMELALLKFKHGPAFGTNATQEEDGSDPLCEVLAVNGRRCSLIDRNDVLCRHVTGSANAFACTSDEECTAAAVKEAANAATHFLWTQLRALGSHLEARAWHRRDLTKAELAAGVPITGIQSQPRSAPSSSQPAASMSARGKAAHADQKAAGTKRKRREHEHPSADPGSEQRSPARACKAARHAAKHAALKSHPIDADIEEGGELPECLEDSCTASPTAVDRSVAKGASSGPSAATAAADGQEDAALQESMEELAARACLHRQHAMSAPPPQDLLEPDSSPGQRITAGSRADASHAASNGGHLSEQDPLGEAAQALDSDNMGPIAGDEAPQSGEPARAESQAQVGSDVARQEAQLTPEQELAKQRQIDEQDERQLPAVLSQLSQSLGRIWQAVPVNALFVVMAGHGDTADVRRLQEQKWRRQQGLDGLPPWNTAAEEALAAAMHHALQGLCFCAVKQ